MSTKDFWLTRRPVVRTDKIRQVMTLAAGTYNSGLVAGSQDLSQAWNLYKADVTATTLVEKECTLEFWYNVIAPFGFTARDVVFISSAILYNLKVRCDASAGVWKIVIGDSVPTFVTLNTGIAIEYNTWHHYAVTRSYAAGTTTIKFYVDGVLRYTGTDGTLNGNNVTPTYSVYVGDQTSSSVLALGYLAQLRLWSSVRTDGEIAWGYNKVLGYPQAGSGQYTTLLHSLPMDYIEASPDEIISRGVEFANTYAITGINPIIMSSLQYPANALTFGGSFVVCQWPVTLTYQTSLVWPVEVPTGTTGMLCVRWTDDDGVVQRRKLWDMDGVDIVPVPDLYEGEKLDITFYLELWNIDGAATTVLGADLEVSVALCTAPTTSYDHTQQTITTPVADSTLAANYPLTFPITFNTQQVYTI